MAPPPPDARPTARRSTGNHPMDGPRVTDATLSEEDPDAFQMFVCGFGRSQGRPDWGGAGDVRDYGRSWTGVNETQIETRLPAPAGGDHSETVGTGQVSEKSPSGSACRAMAAMCPTCSRSRASSMVCCRAATTSDRAAMTVSWWSLVPSTWAARRSATASTLTEQVGSGVDGVVGSGVDLDLRRGADGAGSGMGAAVRGGSGATMSGLPSTLTTGFR